MRSIIMILLWPALCLAIDQDVQGLLDRGNYPAAYERLLQLAESRSDDEEILYLLGTTALRTNSSVEYLKEYMQQYPKGIYVQDVKKHLADYYATSGMNITAANMYDDVPTASDIDDAGLYRVALYKQQTGDYKTAEEIYGLLLNSGDQMSQWARLGMSDCSLLRKEYDKAIKGYESIIEKAPDSDVIPMAMLGMTEAYKLSGKPDKAEKSYAFYREKYPDGPPSDELEAEIADSKAEARQIAIPKGVKAAYYVQVGVFAKGDNARICVRKFRSMKYEVISEDFTEGGQNYIRVLVGPYKNEASAKDVKDDLENSEGEDYLIIIK